MANPLLTLAARAARALPPSLRERLYKLGPISRMVRSALNQAAPKGLSIVEVAAGPLAGQKLSLDLQREKDLWLGTYEPQLQKAAALFIKPGMTVYDVGGNIGYTTIIFALAVGPAGRVFYFEALAANVDRAIRNLQLNRLHDRVRVTHAAVVDKSGETVFITHESHAMGKASGSGGRPLSPKEILRVPALSLDDFIYQQGNSPPDLVKMDIEGGELLCLPGMSRTLEEARPIVFLEMHGEKAAARAWETFSSAGYQLYRMGKNYPRIHEQAGLDWKSYLVAAPRETPLPISDPASTQT